MLQTPIERPTASRDKVTTSENFELCYLRHQYFRRVKYNPTPEEMQPFMAIVEHLTKNTFFTYFNLFKNVGMYHDDVLNIGRVHLVSFLGLYALDKTETKKREFEVKFHVYNGRHAEEKDIEQKNKANFTMFFKQRMEDLVRVCRQKVRNVKGQPSEEFAVFCGTKKPPKKYPILLKQFQELGYKKVDFAVFKSIRKKADVNHDATIFEFGGLWYVAIALEQKNLELDDLIGSEYNPYDNAHNAQPDQNLEEKEVQMFTALFEDRSNYRKKILLKKFVAENKNRAHYKEEVSTARKLLRSIGE
jgi:hypothetical protein